MNLFLNPMILLFMSLLLSFMQPSAIERIIPMLCALILFCLSYISSKRIIHTIIFIIYFLLSCFMLEFFIFLPICVYIYASDENKRSCICLLIPCMLHLSTTNVYVCFMVLIEIVFAILLKLQFDHSYMVEEAFRIQRDASKELAIRVAAQNKDLIIQQEQEIRIATLDERNRIAREIHDNVGHLLSSTLIQVGALQIIAKDDEVKSGLYDIRATLSTAMDSVRKSVHDLHAESLDLEMMITKLVEKFTYCEVHVEYDIVHCFKQNVIYHILAIIKECMNNTMKHSNATRLHIVIREQPAFFQVICSDNGAQSHILDTGIGLRNIQDRIEALHGYVNISNQDGFKVFITLPKEESVCVL